MITFSEVTKQFGNGVFALKSVSFHVEPGEFVVVTGPSGSGKTTLMRLLMKEYTPTSGEVWYKGKSLNLLHHSQIPFHRRKIGVVFQDYRLLPEMNIWENIALPLMIMGKTESEIESRVTDLLNLVSLSEKALMFPKQLSGGEAQRVSIARALATGPSLIFADEPTGNLDKEASLEIMKLLQQIHSFGTTILLATHDVALLEKVEEERHLELEKGELKRDSRPAQPPHTQKEKDSHAKTQAPASFPPKKAQPSPQKEESDADLVAEFTQTSLTSESKNGFPNGKPPKHAHPFSPAASKQTQPTPEPPAKETSKSKKPQAQEKKTTPVAKTSSQDKPAEPEKAPEKKKKDSKLAFWKKKKTMDSEKKL